MFTQYQLFNTYSTSNILVNSDYQRYIYRSERRREEGSDGRKEEKNRRKKERKCVCAVIFIPPLVCVNTLPMRRCRRS